MTTARELVNAGATVRAAMQAIEASPSKIAVVVADDGRLLGTATDGDIRRALLAGTGLDTPIERVMNTRPVYGSDTDGPERWLETMRQSGRLQLPILDARHRVVRVVSQRTLTREATHPNLVFILAGGLGTRLQPLTKSAPKPMLPIGGKPILEHIVDHLIGQGYRRFCFAVRYLSDSITAHFGDGARFGAQVDYVVESDPLGTAGALTLLESAETEPLLVMNGDILTGLNFPQLLSFHRESGGIATIGVRPHSLNVPYGVVDLEGHRVCEIREKPTVEFLVSAGIYCLDPRVVEIVQADGERRLDMPDLLRDLISRGEGVNAFPLHESWLDVGQMDDLDRARIEFANSEDPLSGA